MLISGCIYSVSAHINNMIAFIKYLIVKNNDKMILYVTRYEKIDHLQFFTKFAFLVWINAKFTVEFNGSITRA